MKHNGLSPKARLPHLVVRKIRALYRKGIFSQRELAEKFNTSQTAVYNILTGKTYKAVT